MIGRFVSAAVLALFCNAAAAQHATEFDIESGEQAFANACAACHGPDGNLIEGIDLGRGIFRRPLTDDEIVGIIVNGIPDTPMPPTPGMSEEQAQRIVAYLRSTAESKRGATIAGDPARGRALFEGRGACMDCHAVNGRGSRTGPDLSDIGRLRGAGELELALLDPEAAVQPQHRTYTVTTRSGATVTGRLLNHDTFTVQLIDADERLRSFTKTELSDHGFAPTTMPSYADELDSREIADIVSFLVSLQSQVTQ